MTNYISYSLYGTKQIYFCGLLANLELAKRHYPGWTIVVYCGHEIPTEFVDTLEKRGVLVIYRNIWPTGAGMFWRFEAVNLIDAERVIFRDCDSRISSRESTAVNQWIGSKKKLHVMRDHPWHYKPILGGMWGVQGKDALKLIADALSNFTVTSFEYGDDQNFLAEHVYPFFLNDIYSNDSFFHFEKSTHPFTKRANFEFIGESIQCDGKPDDSNRQAVKRYESSAFWKLELRIREFFRSM